MTLSDVERRGAEQGSDPRGVDGGSDPRNTAELLVETLTRQGVEVVFLNPGTDTAPVQEAIARLGADGRPVPRVVLCPHEAVALAAAHAYYAVTGRPQVVMVHVDVGTQNLGSMLHNAFRSEIAVLILAGRTPVTAYGEQAGGRDTPVHWHQDVPDQAGIVRSYVKWTGDVASAATLPRQIGRALQVARAGTPGPVYLTMGREVLMEPLTEPVDLPAVDRYGPPAPPAANPDALERAAQLLVDSRNPLITTTRVGRDPDAVPAMVRLADLLGAPVVDRRERVNFPSSHPSYVTDPRTSTALLRDADVVLVVDSDVPWIPNRAAPSDSAVVVQIDADPVKATTPGWSFPVDVPIQADPTTALVQLVDAVERRLRQDGAAERTRRPSPAPAPRPDAGSSRPVAADSPMRPETFVAILDEVLREDDVVVEEVTTNSEVLRNGLRRDIPGTHFQSGGSGLGWALGAAVGVKLAAPGSRVVALVGDGSFLFSQPTPALWVAHHERTPVLVVVLRNGGYAASRRPVFALFPDGASAASGEVVGTRFTDGPDFTQVAAACHAHAEQVSDPAEVRAALQRGLDAVAGGRSAVVVVDVSSPWL
ncbi:thiamine pyrophosphate-requiring protein [Geodermatophilus sabuli]|uniref:Thiamine pyrophosphate-requiring protein n=1 Tax=Geodermatophilus sabuli TaxID=1564158 RepID=A0A7K3W454_9ACTN|nr:thiamine pyrophosphate-requiring protein [Geodermatophilus sabuli]NEK59123.1 thiamine pyrophosphate-requiring protein [Geodermatophilus sabuli]